MSSETQQTTRKQTLECWRQEALAVLDWVRQTGAKRIVICTDLFPTRRVLWIFRRTLKPTGPQVLIVTHQMPSYSDANWWRREEGLIAFQNEVIKYAYYLDPALVAPQKVDLSTAGRAFHALTTL